LLHWGHSDNIPRGWSAIITTQPLRLIIDLNDYHHPVPALSSKAGDGIDFLDAAFDGRSAAQTQDAVPTCKEATLF
jgi:hypothetical protein